MVVVRLELALSGIPCQEAGESPMSPNRRGVIVEDKGIAVKENVATNEKVANLVAKKRVANKVAKKSFAKMVAKKKVTETWNRTSPSVTSVRNLRNSPLVECSRRHRSGWWVLLLLLH